MTVTCAGNREQPVEKRKQNFEASAWIQSISKTSDRNGISASRLSGEPDFLSLS